MGEFEGWESVCELIRDLVEVEYWDFTDTESGGVCLPSEGAVLSLLFSFWSISYLGRIDA